MTWNLRKTNIRLNVRPVHEWDARPKQNLIAGLTPVARALHRARRERECVKVPVVQNFSHRRKYMKSLIAFACSFLFLAQAHAEIITLDTESCTATKICFNVPNDAGVSVDYISNATQYGRLVLSLNGDIYDSGLWAYPTLTDSPLYDANGAVIYVTLVFSEVRKPCVRSGRVTVCPVVITLTSGSVQE